MRAVIAFAVAACAAAAVAVPALGDGPVPGTPGTSSCRGQTVVYLAQQEKLGFIDANGLGGLVHYAASYGQTLSVQDLQELAETYCGGPQPPTPGTAGCHGQMLKYLASLGAANDVQAARGVGQLARFLTESGAPTTVQGLQQLADAYCGS